MQLLYFTLIVAGVTYVLTQSLIARPYRRAVASLGGFWAALVYCPPCTGFWVGLGFGFTELWPGPGRPLYAAIASMALMALWKEWGPQENTWALDHGDDDDNPSEEENG